MNNGDLSIILLVAAVIILALIGLFSGSIIISEQNNTLSCEEKWCNVRSSDYQRIGYNTYGCVDRIDGQVTMVPKSSCGGAYE